MADPYFVDDLPSQYFDKDPEETAEWKASLDAVVKALPALRNPTISPLSSPEWIALETIIDESVVREIIPQLKALGAEGIVEYPLNKVVY